MIRSYLLLLFCVTLWGSNFVFGSMLVKEFPPLFLADVRLLFTSMFLIIYAWLTKKFVKITARELGLLVLPGMIVLVSPARKRLSHTGSITMMIQKAHRNKGIGKVLLMELLAWAKQHPLIEKVSLGVFSNNLRAIALYKSLGFVEEGRKVKEFKLAENEYADDVLMYKFV